MMNAVTTSPDDLFSWDCRSGRDEKRPERLLQERKKCLYRSSVSSKARRYPDFIRKNSPNPNEFAQFAFNLLMRPDDHVTKSGHPGEFSHSLTLRMTRKLNTRRPFLIE